MALGATGVILGLSAAVLLSSFPEPNSASPIASEGNTVTRAQDDPPKLPIATPGAPDADELANEPAAGGPADSGAGISTGDFAAEKFLDEYTGAKVTLTDPPATVAKKPPKSGAAKTVKPTPTPTGIPTPKPKDEPVTATTCFESDKAVWADCTAGYIAPEIAVAGVIGCVARDRAAGSWEVTFAFKVTGGNHNGIGSWSGMDNNTAGTYSVLVLGLPEDALTYPTPFGLNAAVFMKPMNGLKGSIDRIDQGFDYVVPNLSGICN